MSVVTNSSTDRFRRTSGTMPATTSDFTVCGWFYFATDTNAYATIFCINNATGTPTDGWYLQTLSDGTTLAIWDQDADTWYSANIGTITTGNWYHVAIRKNGTNLRGSLRVRTTLTYTTATCAGAPADTFTAANLEFGNDAFPDPATGNFCNWKIYQAELTDAELLQESLRFIPSRWANLWAWYPMLNTGGQDYGPNAYSLNVSTNTSVGDNPPIPWGASVQLFPYAVASGSATDLTVQEATHTHAADAIALTVNAMLAVTEATHTHAADAIALTVNATLAVTEVAHTHAADAIALTANATLAVTEATHTHAADAITLTLGYSLAITETTHTHAADAIALTVNATLAVTEAAHTHAADAIGLTVNAVLTVTDASHTHAADAITLTSASHLTVTDATHEHTTDNIVLGVNGTTNLTVANAAHEHSADAVTLTVNAYLAVTDATHAHSADAITLTLVYLLAVIDAAHTHSADAIALTSLSYLAISDAAHEHTADVISLSVPAVAERKSRFFRRYVQPHGRGDKYRG